MLTGDKLETAENIGYSCCLFDSKTHLFRIEITEAYEIVRRLELINTFGRENDLTLLQIQEKWY